MDKISYALGLGIGQQIKNMNIENFSIEDFAKSISDVMEGKETAFSAREAQMMLQEYFTKKQKEEAQAHIAESCRTALQGIYLAAGQIRRCL